MIWLKDFLFLLSYFSTFFFSSFSDLDQFPDPPQINPKKSFNTRAQKWNSCIKTIVQRNHFIFAFDTISFALSNHVLSRED